MATITPLKITEEGLTGVTADCAAGGDEFVNTGVEFIRISNDHASAAYTVTVVVQTTSLKFSRHGKLTKSNTVKTVNAGASALIGPLKTTVWNDANGKVQLTYIVGSSGAAVISGDHLLKIEILYLEQK